MIIWLDAQISPAIAQWIQFTFDVPTYPLRDLGLRESADLAIFDAARAAKATVMTKDSDFVKLCNYYGAPPQIIWLTCGNTSNQHLRTILEGALPKALLLLENGESLVEIGGK